jgi:hypothetical protein
MKLHVILTPHFHGAVTPIRIGDRMGNRKRLQMETGFLWGLMKMFRNQKRWLLNFVNVVHH